MIFIQMTNRVSIANVDRFIMECLNNLSRLLYGIQPADYTVCMRNFTMVHHIANLSGTGAY